MPCSCNFQKTNNQLIKNGYISIYQTNILPFDTCPICAIKHLSYALIKFDNQKQRCLANLYLAYKHLYKAFDIQTTKCFQLIKKFLTNTLTKQNILQIISLIQILIEEYKKHPDNYKDKSIENYKILQNLLTNKQVLYIKLLACNELYNFEVGYKDINTPYIIGLLQECTQLEDSLIWKNKIREQWKNIEANKHLSSKDFLNFAYQFFYRNNKK